MESKASESFVVIRGEGYDKSKYLPLESRVYHSIKEDCCGVLVSLTKKDDARGKSNTYAFHFGTQISGKLTDENVNLSSKNIANGLETKNVKFGYASKTFSTCFCVIGHNHKVHNAWSGSLDFLFHLSFQHVPVRYTKEVRPGMKYDYVKMLLLKILGAVKKEVVGKSGSFHYQSISKEEDLSEVVKQLFKDERTQMDLPDLCLLKLDQGDFHVPFVSPPAQDNFKATIQKDLGNDCQYSYHPGFFQVGSTSWRDRLFKPASVKSREEGTKEQLGEGEGESVMVEGEKQKVVILVKGFNVSYPIFYPEERNLQAPRNVYMKLNETMKQQTNSYGFSSTAKENIGQLNLFKIGDNARAIESLERKVDEKFDVVLKTLKELQATMSTQFSSMQTQVSSMQTQFSSMQTQFSSMQTSLRRVESDVVQNKLALQRSELRDPDEISDVNEDLDCVFLVNAPKFKLSEICEFERVSVKENIYTIKVKSKGKTPGASVKIRELCVKIDEENKKILSRYVS